MSKRELGDMGPSHYYTQAASALFSKVPWKDTAIWTSKNMGRIVSDYASRYRYTPLKSPDSVRMIQFSVEGSKIQAKLEEVCLSEAPDYIALSYVWGSSNPKQDLMISERKLLIGPNLASFMRHFDKVCQQTVKTLKSFWIDAVCIDQSNDI